MTLLTAEDVAETHTYLAHAWPDWKGSVKGVVRRGGPWPCKTCDSGSLLSYRCSRCGADLAEG